MKYSAPSTESREPVETKHPLSGEGGVVTAVPSERDPFEVLDELMVVVEGLCPEWPQRDVFKKNGLFRI